VNRRTRWCGSTRSGRRRQAFSTTAIQISDEFRDQSFHLTVIPAIADSNARDLMPADELFQTSFGIHGIAMRSAHVDHGILDISAVFQENDDMGGISVAGVDGQHLLAPKGWLEQQTA